MTIRCLGFIFGSLLSRAAPAGNLVVAGDEWCFGQGAMSTNTANTTVFIRNVTLDFGGAGKSY